MPAHSIELTQRPAVFLRYDTDWACPTCAKHMAIVYEDTAQIECPFCLMTKAGKDRILVVGWILTRSAKDHINASPARS